MAGPAGKPKGRPKGKPTLMPTFSQKAGQAQRQKAHEKGWTAERFSQGPGNAKGVIAVEKPKAGSARPPSVSKEHWDQSVKREQALARKPGMTQARIGEGKMGHPIAVSEKDLASAKAGKGTLHEYGYVPHKFPRPPHRGAR